MPLPAGSPSLLPSDQGFGGDTQCSVAAKVAT